MVLVLFSYFVCVIVLERERERNSVGVFWVVVADAVYIFWVVGYIILL